MAFGAFVDLEDGATGLVHISQLTEGRTENTQDVVKVKTELKNRLNLFINSPTGIRSFRLATKLAFESLALKTVNSPSR